jgi:hypothetical protein
MPVKLLLADLWKIYLVLVSGFLPGFLEKMKQLYPNTKRLLERRQVAIGISGVFPGYFRVVKIRNLSLIDLV